MDWVSLVMSLVIVLVIFGIVAEAMKQYQLARWIALAILVMIAVWAFVAANDAHRLMLHPR